MPYSIFLVPVKRQYFQVFHIRVDAFFDSLFSIFVFKKYYLVVCLSPTESYTIHKF